MAKVLRSNSRAMSTTIVRCTNCQTAFADANDLYCSNCGHAKPRSADDALLGQVLDARYSILAQIGQGASGTVYRAEHVVLGRKVAIKVLHLELSRDEMALERFRREATTVAAIENEHIVQISDIGRTADGRLYFAMELVEGQTLDVLLAQVQTLEIKRAAEILIQIAEALMEAHGIGYVHRDIRPRNILLSQRRRFTDFVKLLDFGLAKLVDSDQQAASTTLGMTFGDPRYMSPEQARGDRIDRRSDIYQLGCVAYEMLTGAPPFVGEQVFDILTKQVEQAPAPITSRRQGVPLWMEATVTRMLTKRADDRFATMSRLVQALQMGLASGEVMDGDVARTNEEQPPASVSPAIDRVALEAVSLHKTQLGSASAEVDLRPSSGEVQSTVIGRSVVQAAPLASAASPVSPYAPPAPSVQKNPLTKTIAAHSPVASSQMPLQKQVAPAAVSTVDPSSVSNLWFADPNEDDSHTGSDDHNRSHRRRKFRDTDSAGSSEFLPSVGRKKRGWLIGLAVLALGGGAAAMIMSSSPSSAPVIATAPPVAAIIDAAGTAPVAVVPAAPDAGVTAVAPSIPIVPSERSKPVPRADVEKDKPGKAVRVPDPRSPAGKKTVVEEEDSLLARRPGGNPPTVTTPPASGPSKPPPPTSPSVGGSDQTLDPYNAPPATVITTNGGDDPVSPTPSTPPGPPATINAKAESDTLAFQGEQARDAGDIASAAALFRKSLTVNPRNLTAAMGLGQIASDQGQFEDATSHFRKATRIAPNSTIAHTRLGESLLNSGNKEGAAKAFERALKLDPDNARARDGFAEATQ
jgi:eukaryotic-like serine/threonine-protein kinase